MKEIPAEVAERMLQCLLTEEYECENDTEELPCWRSRLICDAFQVKPAVPVYPSRLNGRAAPELEELIKSL